MGSRAVAVAVGETEEVDRNARTLLEKLDSRIMYQLSITGI